ncbi:MAG TPA: GNAT family N-acetyltransferase [Gemmatimonadales bacterium]|nr:GNAT family N-acetyltransferase [Gemmatimonadales bacterium]
MAARVLMITSDYPTPGKPRTTHFIKRQAEFLGAAGVDVDVFHFQGEKRLGNYAAAWLEAQRRLQRGDYDLVHAQFGQSGLLALPKRVPLVVTLRGSDLLGIVDDRTGRYTWKGRLLQRATRHVARVADAVIVVSAHMAPLVDTKAPVHVIPSGIDLELFYPRSRDAARRALGLDSDERLVLFAGRPNQARKRHALAAQAVELLQQRLPVRFVVAWGVMHEQMPDYFNACDVLIHTSMQEGSPNVVKEALACNLPVVSVPVGDVAERLAGIEGCELTIDDRPETIADALERVLRRGERCDGRDAVRCLDERLLTGRVIDIYETAMRDRARSAVAPPQVLDGELVLREATPAEIDCWDALIRQFPDHRVVHTRSWLQSLEASRLGTARYIVAERQGRIVACLPGLIAKLGPLKLFGSPLPGWQTVGMGPLFDAAVVDAAELSRRLIPFLRKRFGVHHVEIMTDRLPAEAMQAAGFRGEPFHTFRTDLKPGDKERTFKGFKDSARRNVKRAERLGLIVRFEDDDRFTAEHFDQIKEVFERGGNALPFRRERVEAYVQAMREAGALAGVSVYLPDGTTNIATGTFTIYGNELLLWMWTHRTAYRWFRPTELMTWAVMQRAMQAGCTSMDLAGRGDFKAKLGAIPDSSRTRWVWSRYGWLFAVRGVAGRVYRWQQRMRGLVRSALRPKLVPVVAEEPSVPAAPAKPAPPQRQRTKANKVQV